jgi:biotin transport system permease protein
MGRTGMRMASFYAQRQTWLHAVAASVKLLVFAVLGTLLFWLQSLPVLLGLGAACVVVFVSLGDATQGVRRLLRAVLLAGVLVGGFHVLMQQPLLGLLSMVRLFSAALLGMAVTVTTSTSELLDLLEKLLAPLQRFGVHPERVALRVALMLRFTEHFFVQWQRLDDAYRVRTGRSGGLHLLAPLTILMLLAARRVADTLQIRLGE